MKLLIALLYSTIFITFIGCGKKPKLDPKFDPSLYEQIDINFYKGKTDGKVYIRTGMLQPVKDSADKVVYYFKEIPGLDLTTFERLNQGGYYAKDKNHVYTWDINASGEEILVLEGADPKSFQSIAYRWGKDSMAVYFENKRINGLTPSELSFVCFEEEDSAMIYIDYIRDKDQLFYKDTEVKVPSDVDIMKISCSEDLLGNPFLSHGDHLYIIRNGAMEIYQ
jgi:DKNYY family